MQLSAWQSVCYLASPPSYPYGQPRMLICMLSAQQVQWQACIVQAEGADNDTSMQGYDALGGNLIGSVMAALRFQVGCMLPLMLFDLTCMCSRHVKL